MGANLGDPASLFLSTLLQEELKKGEESQCLPATSVLPSNTPSIPGENQEFLLLLVDLLAQKLAPKLLEALLKTGSQRMVLGAVVPSEKGEAAWLDDGTRKNGSLELNNMADAGVSKWEVELLRLRATASRLKKKPKLSISKSSERKEGSKRKAKPRAGTS